MSARTERRGFSLLELMVASAVGLIILLAAMAAFDLQASFSRHTERLLGAQASSGLGLTMMQRDLEELRPALPGRRAGRRGGELGSGGAALRSARDQHHRPLQ